METQVKVTGDSIRWEAQVWLKDNVAKGDAALIVEHRGSFTTLTAIVTGTISNVTKTQVTLQAKNGNAYQFMRRSGEERGAQTYHTRRVVPATAEIVAYYDMMVAEQEQASATRALANRLNDYNFKNLNAETLRAIAALIPGMGAE